MSAARAGLAVLTFLIFSANLRAETTAEITMAEILRLHAEEKDAVTSARITFTEETYASPSHLKALREERRKQLLAAGNVDLAKRLDSQAETGLQRLLNNAARETHFVFDLPSQCFLWRSVDSRDIDRLAGDMRLDEDARSQLHKTTARAVVRGENREYSSGGNSLMIMADDMHRTSVHHLLSSGLITGSFAKMLENAEIAEDPDDANLVVLRRSMEGMLFEMTLDRSMGLRQTSVRVFSGQTLLQENKWEYQTSGGLVVPSVIEQKRYDPDGTLSESKKITVTSVEVNIPIDPLEFVLEAPAGAEVRDLTAGGAGRQQLQVVAETAAEKAAEELIEQAIEEEPAKPAVKAPQAAVEPVHVPETQVPASPDQPAGPAAAGRRGPKGLLVVIVAVMVVLILLVVFLKRRQSAA